MFSVAPPPQCLCACPHPQTGAFSKQHPSCLSPSPVTKINNSSSRLGLYLEKEGECTRWCYYLENLTGNSAVQEGFAVKTGPRVWFPKRREDSECWTKGWGEAHAGDWPVSQQLGVWLNEESWFCSSPGDIRTILNSLGA